MPVDPLKGRKQTTARAKVTLSVAVNSAWGGDCTNDQVHKQAVDEAVSTVRMLLSAETSADRREELAARCKLVDTIEISQIIVTRSVD